MHSVNLPITPGEKFTHTVTVDPIYDLTGCLVVFTNTLVVARCKVVSKRKVRVELSETETLVSGLRGQLSFLLIAGIEGKAVSVVRGFTFVPRPEPAKV